MAVCTTKLGTPWRTREVEVRPYGPLLMEPSATIINYGQGLFEGVKAHRTVNDRIVVFRGEKNGQRLAAGARALSMPEVPHELFMKNIATAVRENADLVPPAGMGSLYLRPILFGSGPGLGVSPSPEYHFMTYVSPVGEYFSGPAATQGARMKIEREHSRAARNGNGGTKAAGNYAPCFKYQQQAKAEGYTDIIYMDNWTGERVEEVACANLFVVEKDRICTPPLGMILPGVTRMTVMQLIEEIGDKELGGRKLYEGDVTLENIANAEEIFCTGTAAVISPISHVGESDPNSKHKYDFIPMGPVTTKLREILTGIQAERLPDTHNWLRDPFDEDAFCA
eukprot:CAMPEP_0179000320 /NCGR_PEP_ID=MMETSP0795-20121207/10596_1 /TAXON_ID=88552 /ORGANISM="Amoebophrya sp., Strain Ameob2" /LENGTH=337 /DNA_ID=CAMNT_0020693283 /DNA_START=419 /DNA_END=1432 /DNA_ORIENTATION=-